MEYLVPETGLEKFAPFAYVTLYASLLLLALPTFGDLLASLP
jgi:hypothetical protein